MRATGLPGWAPTPVGGPLTRGGPGANPSLDGRSRAVISARPAVRPAGPGAQRGALGQGLFP